MIETSDATGAAGADTDATGADTTAEPGPADALAPWWTRAAAFTVDVLPGAAVLTTMALAASAVPLGGVWWWVAVSVAGLAAVATAGNRILLPATIGWGLGRAVFGIVVRRDAGATGDPADPAAPVGPWRLLVRDLAHLLDTASVLVGWLWPLWDRRRRTFADMLAHTEVRRAGPAAQPPRNASTAAAIAFLVAALLCITVGVSSALVVYQHDRAIARARAQIAVQGPRIVEQMLSYDPQTLQADFEQARSLVTDRYRERLQSEQETVLKGAAVVNEYWVVNRSVLSVTPHQAAMLMFLQGQRGGKNERMISATVRVAFEKSGSAQWRVDDLIVLTKPLPAEPLPAEGGN